MDNFLISVSANDTPRINRVVKVNLTLTLDEVAGIRLEEIGADHKMMDSHVPFQVDGQPSGQYALTFLMSGYTEPDAIRHYRLCLDTESIVERHPPPQVSVSDIYHQGQQAFLIRTSNATLIFHKEGGGFASLIDSDEHDWISYRPQGGSDGKYRGIPNIKHPDDYYHPGATNARSHLLCAGAVNCRIHTQTNDGVCEAIWDIYPHYMTFTLLKAPDVYWLLYEGTPGGALDEINGFVVWSDGTRKPLSESWQTILDPGWLYFGASTTERSLFFAQHETEHKLSSYFPMEGNMTVFGFGRKDLEHYLTQVPAQYSFGLVDSHDHDHIAAHIESIRKPVHVEVNPMVEVT